ncbi:MAG: aldehyde dehydrogenase family protein [Verrucomicrobiales bacterium]
MPGGQNHLIVVPDADPEITAKNVVSSATGCAGQRCMAASVLITVGNCDAVMRAIAAEMRAVVPGKNLGAIISGTAKARIEGFIDRAEAAGARITVDGRGTVVQGRRGILCWSHSDRRAGCGQRVCL